jgi:hypothetical protein
MAKACGPGTPMLVSRTTGTKSPAPRGERAISRKPLRRECRCFGVPAAFSFCMRAAGATGASGAPCALCFRGSWHKQSSGISCRENAKTCPCPSCRRRCLKFESKEAENCRVGKGAKRRAHHDLSTPGGSQRRACLRFAHPTKPRSVRFSGFPHISDPSH